MGDRGYNQTKSSAVQYWTVFLLLLTVLFPLNICLGAKVVDTDKDGLSDEIEAALGTDLNNPDSDGDGFKDGEEVASGFNPFAGDENRDIERTATVDLNTQQLKYYVNGVELGTIAVSTGLRGLDTPTGTFNILRKLPSVRYLGRDYDFPNTKWNLEFKQRYFLHGAYWHNQFGIRPMSHGCVNIGYKGAETLYKFLQIGDEVKITGRTPSGRVAKKVAKQ